MKSEHTDGLVEIKSELLGLVEKVNELIDPSIPVEPIEDNFVIGTTFFEYLGLHEERDNGKLMKLFEEADVRIAGEVVDPDEWAWCAAFFSAIVIMAGFSIQPSVNAKSFSRVFTIISKSINDSVLGCALVWGNHIGIFMGWADNFKLMELETPFKVSSVEEWESVKCDKDDPNAIPMCGGGNQSDMVNISPADWYSKYSDFIGCFEVS